MRVVFTPHFQRSFQKLSDAVQRALERQLIHLLRDLRHPSLRAKKYDEATGMWQARVTKGHRFYFQIEGNTYVLHEITAHRK